MTTLIHIHSPSESISLSGKWRVLLLLCLAEFLAMTVWFSASAVVPALMTTWPLDANAQAWLTLSVQIGFVVGAFGSAVLALADRIPTTRYFMLAAFAAAIATALIPLAATGIEMALLLRFLTGLCLAGVYPVGMKIMSTWTKADRGLGIGLIVGALTLGSAAPHLLNALGGVHDWRIVLYAAAGAAALGGLITGLFVKEGPYRSASPRFDRRQIALTLRDRGFMLANLGYLGHMWELYAMWAWIAAFLTASFALSGVDPVWANLATFSVIGIGCLSSILAGILADRVGRTTITIVSLIVSGTCAFFIGQFFGGNPVLLTLIALIWGFAIVADSAQFSACISELADKQFIGTALTLQTSMGFLLTLVTIRAVPLLRTALGWQWVFAFLAIGPVFGIIAMLILRRSPLASKLANGRR